MNYPLIGRAVTWCVLVLAVVGGVASGRAQNMTNGVVQSPSGELVVRVSLNPRGELRYAISRAGQPVLTESKLGVVREDADLSTGLRLVEQTKMTKVSDKYEILTAKRRVNKYQANRKIFRLAAHDGQRIDYLTSNRWSSFETIADVILPDDPHIALTLHFYEPFIFTHQRANWVQLPADMPLIRFPGRVPDLSKIVPADHFTQKSSNTELTTAEIDAAFAKLAAWADKNLKGRELYIGEFGAYSPADDDSKRAYAKAVTTAAQRHHWSWAVWDYQGGFAIRTPEGNPTPILEGLLLR